MKWKRARTSRHLNNCGEQIRNIFKLKTNVYIFYKENPEMVDKYRPISHLPSFKKIFGKAMVSYINKYNRGKIYFQKMISANDTIAELKEGTSKMSNQQYVYW